MWSNVTGFFADALAFLEGAFSFTGAASWGWAIIALTLITRILLLPLNIKQTRSMRKMQQVAPKVKAIQKKYKVDRELMRSNPEKYRMMKQKANEEVMALYKDEGVNPAGGCLPLLAQMPVFFALFSVLRDKTNEALASAPFYFFTSEVTSSTINFGTVEDPHLVPGGLGSATSSAGWPGWLLIVLMGATMFITQKQMMGRNSATVDAAQQQQQKIMLYAMPVILAAVSVQLPLGVLLYWVTTNLWQLVQQQIMFRDLKVSTANEAVAPRPSNRGKGTGTPGAKKPSPSDDASNAAAGDHRAKKQAEAPKPDAKGKRKRGHLPGGS